MPAITKRARGVSMDHRARQPWQRVQQAVLGVVGDVVTFGEREVGIDVELGLGVQVVADPAHLQRTHLMNTGGGSQTLLSLGH